MVVVLNLLLATEYAPTGLLCMRMAEAEAHEQGRLTLMS
jgi:hypothetical protein